MEVIKLKGYLTGQTCKMVVKLHKAEGGPDRTCSQNGGQTAQS